MQRGIFKLLFLAASICPIATAQSGAGVKPQFTETSGNSRYVSIDPQAQEVAAMTTTQAAREASGTLTHQNIMNTVLASGDANVLAADTSRGQANYSKSHIGQPLDPKFSHWRLKMHNGSSEGENNLAAPQLELVVSRSTEKLEWVVNVPFFWHVTILNRGVRDHWMPKLPRGRKWSIVNLRGVSSDSEAFAQYLVNRYHRLAEYTVFSPANPLDMNEKFLEALQRPTSMNNVQSLSGVVTKFGRTPVAERISTRTLNSVVIHNPQTVEIAKWFSKDYNLTWGTNLVKKYFDMIGLTTWMDERQEVGTYAPGALVGFERSRATRHPRETYANLMRSATVFGGNHLVIERLWLMLFAGTDFHRQPL